MYSGDYLLYSRARTPKREQFAWTQVPLVLIKYFDRGRGKLVTIPFRGIPKN
jgi:hypothetical protein